MPLPDRSRAEIVCGDAVVATEPLDLAGWFAFEEDPASSDCLLRFSAQGYSPAAVSAKALPKDPQIPAIVLHRLGKGQGESISTSHLAAPADAVEAFHAAVRELRSSSAESRERALQLLIAALDSYPEFAAAWFEIGRLRLASGDAAGAADAMRRAIAADPWYVSPYEPLMLLLEAEGQSIEAASVCEGLRAINPALPKGCS